MTGQVLGTAGVSGSTHGVTFGGTAGAVINIPFSLGEAEGCEGRNGRMGYAGSQGDLSAVGWITMQAWMLRRLDALAYRMGRGALEPRNLVTGARGEREALFHLRKMGYTVVAQRWTSGKLRGDVDLIGWDGEWLCFVEVKTRAGRDVAAAEVAVDHDKQRMLRRMARAYLLGFPKGLQEEVPVRFDVVSVYLQESGAEFEVYKGAFGWA